MRSLCIFLLFAASSINAQKTKDSLRKLCITPQGKTFGKQVSASIGKEGGRIVSEDGKLELIFPQGALEKTTNISIQPQSNTMPSGRGTSYRLEPSGTTFSQPVQVIMHCTDEELKQFQSPITSLALQDHNGQWRQVKDVELDSVNKTITGSIKHFSSLVVYDKALLIPGSETLKVNAKRGFGIYMYISVQDFEDAEIWEMEYRWAMYEEGFFDTKDEPLWRVNGKKNGDAVHGTIAPQADGRAEFTAPASVPKNNPVTVSVEMEMQWKKRPWKIVLPSEVFIVDGGYRYTFIGISQNPGGVFQQIDSSSCFIVIEKEKVRLENIINHQPWSDWPSRTKSGCTLTYQNREGWKGLVEISGMSAGTVILPTETNPLTSVTISLLPAIGNTPHIIEKCPRNPPREKPSFQMPAWPNQIKFDTDGNDINIEYMGIKGKNEINYVKNGEGFIIKIAKY